MAQDNTPSIIIYRGNGDNSQPYDIPFDKGYYGSVKVAFIRRGYTDYTYNPVNFTLTGALYGWQHGLDVVYTDTTIPTVDTPVYDGHNISSIGSVTAVAGMTITAVTTIDGQTVTETYTRAQSQDMQNNAKLYWNGEVLTSDDYICIVRDTQRSQPYEFPNNQKHIEGALDNLERQIQELKDASDSSVKIDTSITTPINWMNTVVRSTDCSVRGFKFDNGFISFSTDDPNIPEEDKTWNNLVRTTNIKNVYYEVVQDPDTGQDLYRVYYQDLQGDLHLLTLDPQIQDNRITDLEVRMDSAEADISTERQMRGSEDARLEGLIADSTFDPTALEQAIAQNTSAISQNSRDIARQETTIATHTTAIAENTADIAQNTSDIQTQSATISNHTTAIATNTSDIAENAADIAQNASDISATDSKFAASVSSASDDTKAMPKSYIDNKVTAIYHLKGIKDYYSDLPSSGNVEADVWMVVNADATHEIGSYVWIITDSTTDPVTGEWQFLGQTFDTTNLVDYTTFNANNVTINTAINGLDNRLAATVTSSDKAQPKSYIDNAISSVSTAVTTLEGKLASTVTSSDKAQPKSYIDNAIDDTKDYIDGIKEDLEAEIAAKEDSITVTRNIVSDDQPGLVKTGSNIAMHGRLAKTITFANKVLTLKDQANQTLSSTPISIGVEADYIAAEEKIKFDEGEGFDADYYNSRINTLFSYVPTGTNSTNNKLVNQTQLDTKANTADLKTVAFTGQYSDLLGTPTIGSGLLTINKNGGLIDTFSANATSNKTINIEVPTSASDVGALPNTTKYGSSIAMSLNTSDNALEVRLLDQDGNDLGTAQRQTLNYVSKTNVTNKVYGTDNSGNQTTYDVTSFGQVDDVRINNSSIVTNKIANITIVDNLTSTSTTSPLSANQGKALNDRLVAVEGRGRYLSIWNCTTGLAETNPPTSPYNYKSGDYFIVGTVGTTNYKPTGSSYTINVASTVVEIEDVNVNDTYIYDGTNWRLQKTAEQTVAFSGIAGDPYDNSNLATALNAKADTTDLPTVNNATLTIQKNGTDVATFTANSATNTTANISVPTAVSELTNDSGYITAPTITYNSETEELTIS